MPAFAKTIFLLIWLLPALAYTQPETSVHFLIPGNQSGVGVHGYGMVGSNALTGQFISDFYQGEHLEETMLRKSEEKLKGSNRMGALTDFGIATSFLLDSASKYRYSVALRDKFHFAAGFEDELFSLVFFGNKQYAGEQVNFAPFSYELLRYQQIQAGIATRDGKSGAAIGLIKGERAETLTLDKGLLFTDEQGKNLDFETSLVQQKSNPNMRGPEAWNGTGFSMDLYTRFTIGENEERFLHAGVQDLGVVWWNSRSTITYVDTSYHWEGVQINNIFTLIDSAGLNANSDSLVNELSSTDTGGFTTLLPGWLKVEFHSPLTEEINIVAGIAQMINKHHRLNYYLQAGYQISPAMRILLQAGYGGYAQIYAGAGLHIQKSKWYLMADAPGLLSLFTVDSPPGLMAQLRTGILFR